MFKAHELQPKNLYLVDYNELTIGNKLAQGGFGTIYQASWRYQDVAVKEFLPEDKMSREAREAFRKECQIMAQLRAPSIVNFFGYSITPKYSIIMEYMAKGSMRNILKNEQPLEWSIRIQMASDIAKGLAVLHHENILHRDIKSANVLIGENYQAKLSDFGLSKIKMENKSDSMQTGSDQDGVATLGWMGPELFSENPVYDEKSDIYSLGMTLWEIVSRKLPCEKIYNIGLIPSLVTKGRREDVPADCPSKFWAIIESCWAGNPNERPSAGSVVDRLEQLKIALAAKDVLIEEREEKKPLTAGMAVKVQQNKQSLLFKSKFKKVIASHQELETFLYLITIGQQSKVESMIKKNPQLVLAHGTVTDPAKRTFKNITGFQYAVWALDWHMWQMIKKYLPLDAICRQRYGIEKGSWVSEHGAHANWQNLMGALETISDNYEKWDWQKISKHLVQKVGVAQSMLPIHVLQEYSQPKRPFRPCPNFKDIYQLERNLPAWLEKGYQKELGKEWAVGRASQDVVRAYNIYNIGWHRIFLMLRGRMNVDKIALTELFNIRTQQRYELMAELAVLSSLKPQDLTFMRKLDDDMKWRDWQKVYNKKRPHAEENGYGPGAVEIYNKKTCMEHP